MGEFLSQERQPSGGSVTACSSALSRGHREPVYGHGCPRELGGHLQSYGDPGAEDQNEKKTLRAAEGEGVSGQRSGPERLYVGRQSLGESVS